MKVRAAVLDSVGGPFTVEQLDLEAPRRGEVLVRLVASGVCHSDWHLVTGATKHPLPVVAGHEGAGIVEAVGQGVTRVIPGDHVILSWAPDCGRCYYCLRDQGNLCDTFLEPIWAGTMLDGSPRLSRAGEPVFHYCGLAAFAERAVIPQESCVPIRSDVSLEVAALVGCAVATGVGAVLYTADVRPGSSVVVYGCGGVGLNAIQGAVLAGAQTIIGVDSVPGKLDMARHFGATATVLAGPRSRQQILALTGGRGADYAFEAVGIPAVQQEALGAVRPGGTLILVGLSPVGESTDLSGALIARQEKTVRGSYYGSVNARRDFPLFLEMYLAGKLDLDDLVSRRYGLDEINEAFRAMLDGEVARGLIVF
ncbi:MAG: Zn-dependent alcohol dehydrogenase [Chloroflexota bacterium]|jgi:NDMA-dependent alcohol dehydrogenase